MKKIFTVSLAILLMILIANCQKSDNEVIEMKKEVTEKRNEIDQLKKEIKILEAKINKNSPKNGQVDNRILINVKKIGFEKFVHYINQNGTIEAVNSAFISPEMNGQIKKIYVKEGQFVKKGKLLIKLNSSVIENNINEVKTALKLAKTVYKKRKGLWAKKIGSEIQFLEAETNMESLKNRLGTLNAQLDMTRIKAPIDGFIETVFPKEGELAIPGVQIIQLINLDKLYINADVSETYLPALRQGDWAELTFPAYPNLKITDSVYLIGHSVNDKNRTFKLKIRIDNLDGKLKPNNLAMIRLMDFVEEKAIIVPSIIIKRDIRGDYLYTLNREDKRVFAKKQYIKIGLSEGSHTMVLKGLNIGDEVIVEGYNLVSNGIEVKFKSETTGIGERKNRQEVVN